MAACHIRKYRESDRQRVLSLFSQGMVEHIPAAYRHVLRRPAVLTLLLAGPLALLLASGSWLLALLCQGTLLGLLWLLTSWPWWKYVDECLRTDMADISTAYLRRGGSGFWVAESGGQVAGMVGALPVEHAPLERRQLQLFHLSVDREHRGEGIAKGLVSTVLRFARDQGYSEVVLETSTVQYAALALYLRLGFQKTGQYFYNTPLRLAAIWTVFLTYRLPSAQEGNL